MAGSWTSSPLAVYSRTQASGRQFCSTTGKAKLIRIWPEGLPTPRKGLRSADDVVTLMNLLDAVEAEFSIPFGETDPRYEGLRGPKRTNVPKEIA